MLLMAAMCVLGFTSCSDDDDIGDNPDTPSEELADYTILLYGCGGSNLDEFLLFNLQQIDGMGYNEKVKFTGLVKFSKPYQNDVKRQGTRLFNMTPGEWRVAKWQIFPSGLRTRRTLPISSSMPRNVCPQRNTS